MNGSSLHLITGRKVTRNKISEVRRKHRITVAEYNALAIENSSRNKCMVTFSSPKRSYFELQSIRELFINKVMSILKRKEYRGQKLAYFSVMEFGHNFSTYWNPHLHIQLYYDDISVIEEAHQYVIKHLSLSEDNCDLLLSHKDTARFNYVIKSFLPKNFNIELEEKKVELYEGKKMYWCSHRITPNYVVRRLYQILRELPIWKQYENKFKLVFDLINKGVIVLEKIKQKSKKGLERIGEWGYEILESPETSPYNNTLENNIKSKEDVPDSKKEGTVNTTRESNTVLGNEGADASSISTYYRDYFATVILFVSILVKTLLKISNWVFFMSWFILLVLLGKRGLTLTRTASSFSLTWYNKRE